MKKLSIVLLTLVLLFTAGCGKKAPTEEQRATEQAKFEEFLKDEMTFFLSLGKMTAHFALKDLSPYGLEDMEVSIGSADETHYDILKESLSKLNAINRDLLTEKQQNFYDRYKLSTEETLSLEGLDDYDFYFAPSTGINSNLLTMFTEFDIRNEQDIKDLIVYVIDSERYLNECIEITRKQVEKGIIQADTTLEGIIKQCEAFINSGNKNSVTVILSSKIDQFDGISSEQKTEYKNQLKDAVNNNMMVGYKNVIAFMQENKGKATNNSAYHNWADGKKYYEARLKIKTSSKLSVEQTKKLLENEIKNCISQLIDLGTNNDSLWNFDEIDVGMTDAKQILEQLKGETSKYFPAPVETNYEVAFLDPSVTAESVSAYYLNPPMDDFTNNVIKVNPETNNALFTTLAHEGYPGHLYQITYEMANNFNPILYYMDFIGYTEGWAVYSESYSYSMAKVDIAEDVAAFDAYNARLSTAMVALSDILVHYEGMSIEELGSYYTRLQLNASNAPFIYELVISDPLMYVPYSTGCVMFSDLKEKTEKALGNKFDLVEFHKVILDTGRAPFEYLEKVMDDYIASKK